jgi:2'-5' RNA ligase
MPVPDFYRYFLGCRPEPSLYPLLRKLVLDAGQDVRLERLHFTFCVVAEMPERDRFLKRRLRAALAGRSLHSFPVNLSRVVGSLQGAEARTFGPQNELQDTYAALVRLLRSIGIEPLHRTSGLRPHMTLGYNPCRFAPRRIGIKWFPRELLLIESEVGLGRHNPIAAWPLLPPRQGRLIFEPPASVSRLAS